MTIVVGPCHTFRTGYTAKTMRGCTMDCRKCKRLLIFPDDIAGQCVRALDFHQYLHSQDPRWPADGHHTYSVGFG